MTGRGKHRLLTMVCALSLVSSGACSQRWTFAPPGQRGAIAGLRRASEGDSPIHASPSGYAESGQSPVQQTSYEDCDTTPATAALFVGPDAPRRPIVGSGLIERLPPLASSAERPLDRISHLGVPLLAGRQAVPQGCSSTASGEAVAHCHEPWRHGRLRQRLPDSLALLRASIVQDHRNYYGWPNMRDLLLGIAGASILANTSMDHDFRDWFQNEVRSDDTDSFADFFKVFGEGEIFASSLAGLGIAGWLLEDIPICDVAGEFGLRTGRAYLVGAPPIVFMQSALGGSRPGETSHESAWRSFEDNNAVSGHAFMGAVPFITGAQMSKNRCVKAGFYILSTLPAWSRIDDDAHYLSHSALGWWMAYLACRSVSQTEAAERHGGFRVAPLLDPNTAGFMAAYEF